MRGALGNQRVYRDLEGLRLPWPFDWQLYEASAGDRRFSSMKRGGAFRRRASNGGETCWSLKSIKTDEGDERLKMKGIDMSKE